MSKKFAVFVCFSLFLSACGGGGGSGASTASNTPGAPSTPSSPSTPAPTSYTGSTKLADITPKNAANIVYDSTLVTDLSNVLMFAGEYRDFRFDSLLHDYSYETAHGECSGGGVKIVADGNKLKATYNHCVSGPYELNGEISVSDFTTRSNGEIVKGKFSFNGFSVKSDFHKQEFDFKGHVNVDFDAKSRAEYEAVVSVSGSNKKYWLNALTVNHETGSSPGYSVSGRIYISDLGYVNVSTLSKGLLKTPDVIKPRIAIAANKIVQVVFEEEQKIGLELVNSKEQLRNNFTLVPYQFLIDGKYKGANSAPIANISNASDSYDKQKVVLFNGLSSTDENFDLLNYQWSLIKKPENASVTIEDQNLSVAKFIFHTAGSYELSLTVSDGLLEDTKTASFTVKQAAPAFTLASTPEKMKVGNHIRIPLTIDSPVEDGPFDTQLLYGPASMKLVGNELEWDGRVPMLGEDQLVNFAVKVKNADYETIVKRSITLLNDSGEAHRVIGTENTTFLHWQDVNNDAIPDAIDISEGVVSATDISSGVTKELWKLVTTTKQINHAVYLKDKNSLIVGADETSYYQYDIKSKKGSLILEREKRHGKSRYFLIENIDNDPAPELITNSHIFDMESKEIQTQTTELASGPMAVIDVNGDGEKELLIGWQILSAKDFKQLYSMEPGSVTSVHAKDVDGDGQQEAIIVKPDRVEVFTFKGGAAKLRQTLSKVAYPGNLSVVFNNNYSSIFITNEKGTTITQYRLEQGGNYVALTPMLIQDPNVIEDENSSCRLFKYLDHNNKLLVGCFKGSKYTYSEQAYSERVSKLGNNYSVIGSQLYGNILLQEGKGFSVGGFRGVTSFDENLKATLHQGPKGKSLRSSYISYWRHSFDGGVPLGWDGNSQYFYGFDISGNELYGSEQIRIATLGLDPMIFKIKGQSYLWSTLHDSLNFFSLPTLEKQARLPVNLGNVSIADNKHLRVIEGESEDILFVWASNQLFQIKLRDKVFSLVQSYTFPESFINKGQSFDLAVMQVMPEQSGYKVTVLVDKGSKLQKGEYYTATGEFKQKDIDLSYQSVGFSNSTGTCNSVNNGRVMSYIYSNRLLVPEEKQANALREGRVFALDLNSGSVVWSSRLFPTHFAADIECQNTDKGLRLILSAGSQLMVTE